MKFPQNKLDGVARVHSPSLKNTASFRQVFLHSNKIHYHRLDDSPNL